MLFDDVLEEVGGSGIYQIGLVIYMFALALVSIDALRMNFAGGQMKHWCTIPALANLSHDHQKYVGIPFTGDEEYSQCRRFNLVFSNYTLDELIKWNRTEMTGHIPESEWVNCDNDWTYDQSEYVSTIVSKWNLVCDRGWMVEMVSTFYMAGWLLGCLFSGPLSDRFGRIPAIIILHTVRTIGGYLALYSPWYEGFAVGRVLMGVGASNSALVLYVIIAEITSKKGRSTFGVSVNIIGSIGGMVLPGFAYYVRDEFYFEGIFIWPLVMVYILILFTVSLVYYGLSLNAGRLPGDIYLNSFLLSMVEAPANLIGMILHPRIGRRWVTGGATVLGGAASMLSVAFISDDSLQVVATALSVFGKACAATGFGGIYIFTAELAPTQIRNIAMGTSSMFARISGMAAPFVGGPMGDIYAGLPSIIFGAFGLVAGSLIFLLPETLGAKLPETIDEAEAFGKK